MFALLVVRAAALFGMFGKGTALNALKARRSVVKYSDKAVPASATQRALEAAIMAPNHFLSEPWRFYTAGPETKAKLCGLNEEKRKAAEGVPEWLVVTCASEHDLSEKLGLESGLGYPSRQQLERMLVGSQLNEGAVMAELKKRAKPDIELMAEIVAAA